MLLYDRLCFSGSWKHLRLDLLLNVDKLINVVIITLIHVLRSEVLLSYSHVVQHTLRYVTTILYCEKTAVSLNRTEDDK